MASYLIYFGTYTRTGRSQGIYAAWLNGETGILCPPVLVAAATDPAWLTISPDRKFLYAIDATPAQAMGFKIDAQTGQLTALPKTAHSTSAPPISPPSHLAIDATGRVLLAANYRDGFVASIPLHGDGTLGSANIIRHEGKGPHPQRQEKAHVHSVTVSPDNRFVIVADLGVDKLFSYALDVDVAKLTPAQPPYVRSAPGAGPRHFKFGLGGAHAYAINELDSTISIYDYDPTSGSLLPKQTVSTLPPDFLDATTTAEIRIHPNGKFLYGSNRGHDSIAVYSIDSATGLLSDPPIEIVSTGGKTPRNFALSPDGQWLVCGHQDSDIVTVFRVNPNTGQLANTGQTVAMPTAVCVAFYD